jgi:phage shock protein A
MQLTIEVPPQVEEMLQKEADRYDLSVQDFIQKMFLSFVDDGVAREMMRVEAGMQSRERGQADTEAEAIINNAVRRMKENQVKNRELSVEAITQKNNLQGEVDREERVLAGLERKARAALLEGDQEQAKLFYQERMLHERTLTNLRKTLLSAITAAEKVKAAIRREEERIRLETAEALATKATIKQTQLLVQLSEQQEALREDTSDMGTPEELDRAIAVWVEAQRTTLPPNAVLEDRIARELLDLRARLDALQQEFLRNQQQKSDSSTW